MSEADKPRPIEEFKKPSWLVATEEEFVALRSGALGTAGKKIAMLHQTGLADTLNADQLSDRAARWGEEAVEEGDEVWPQVAPYLARMADRIQEEDKKGKIETETPTMAPEEEPVLNRRARSVKRVISELTEVLRNPDQTKEQRLKAELNVLGSYAKRIGVFEDLKARIEDIQRKQDFLQAAEDIRRIDVSRYEATARGLSGWDQRLEGILGAYRNAAFYNMMKAWDDEGGVLPQDGTIPPQPFLDRTVELFNYEDPPLQELHNKASVQLERAMHRQIRDSREGGDGGAAPLPPDYVTMTFRDGKYRRYERAWTEVEFLDIRKKEDRDRWVFNNLRLFNELGLADRWKGVLDTWLGDLGDAARRGKLNAEQMAEVEETKKDLIAMIAVTVPARAMELSVGSATSYAKIVTQTPANEREPSLDMQDTWREYLLADDPDKYRKVISIPLVRQYYRRILQDAGMTVAAGRDCGDLLDDGKARAFSEFNLSISTANSPGGLADYLRTKTLRGDGIQDRPYKGGFDAYINERLLQGTDKQNEMNMVAAKLACDAFLAEKYTRWEYLLTRAGDPQSKDEYGMKPLPSWGGDPFRMVLEPAFLPRRVKAVYQGDYSVILVAFDSAFKPSDVFNGTLMGKMVIPSAVEGIKKYYRLNAAMWAALGGSTANGLPMWTKDTFTSMDAIADLLKQVYGGISKKTAEGVFPDEGRHIVGAMVARLIECKTIAATVESARHAGSEASKVLFSPDAARPFMEVEQFLWGPELNGKAGFLAAQAGGRNGLIFRGNKYYAEKSLSNARKIIQTNDQRGSRGRQILLNAFGLIFDVAQIVGGGGKK